MSSSFYNSIEVSATGLSAERLAMDVIANNIANVNTTRTPEGGAFKRQLIVFAQKQDPSATGGTSILRPVDRDAGVSRSAGVAGRRDRPRPRLPTGWSTIRTHPDADANGYVHYPNIDVVKEMVDMIAASRAYQANVTAIQEARSMGNAALNLLKS